MLRDASSSLRSVHLACTRPACADGDQQVAQRARVEQVGIVDATKATRQISPIAWRSWIAPSGYRR
jgi:hypothetical protein